MNALNTVWLQDESLSDFGNLPAPEVIAAEIVEDLGAGSRVYYTLILPPDVPNHPPEQGELPLEGGNRSSEGGKRALPDLPPEQAEHLPHSGERLGEVALRALIRDLCGWQAPRGEELATLLHKDLKYLRNKHLTEMVQTLAFLFPASPNHTLLTYVYSGQHVDPPKSKTMISAHYG